MLSNDQIRYAGPRVLLYRPLPSAGAFHRSDAKNRWLFGGNRSGKSESNIGFDLGSFALGLHPFRPTPEHAVIWAATVSWPMVGKVLWHEKIRRYIPAGRIERVIWHNRAEQIPRELRLRNGTTIEFKSLEQGREQFQGRAIDAYYQDEQSPRDAEAIWQEVQARLMDRNGFSSQSMTPLIHQAWLEQRIQNLPATDAVFYADLNDNRRSRRGHVADSEIDALIAQWPPEIQQTRIKGYFGAFRGSVYKGFRRDLHVIEPFEIPGTWTRYRSIDWGFNNPFVCLWLARDPDNQWFVYAEHYQARELLSYHAQRIKQISGLDRYQTTWADHDAQDRYEFEKLGIKTTPAKKDIRLGIESVQAALKVQANGQPRLFVFRTCVHTIEELIGYRWREGTESYDARDEPMKVNDHTCDALRYAVYGCEGTFYFSQCDFS